MGLLDILRKLGILRFGAKAGTYTNATNRSVEFMVDGVYRADKDLTTKQDIRKVAETVTGKRP